MAFLKACCCLGYKLLWWLLRFWRNLWKWCQAYVGGREGNTLNQNPPTWCALILCVYQAKVSVLPEGFTLQGFTFTRANYGLWEHVFLWKWWTLGWCNFLLIKKVCFLIIHQFNFVSHYSVTLNSNFIVFLITNYVLIITDAVLTVRYE